MTRLRPLLWLAPLAAALALLAASGLDPLRAQDAKPSALTVIWSSGDPDVAHRVCLMYTHAAKTAGWFDQVELIVWGPSARLLAADKDLQAKVHRMQQDGVVVRACIVCADSFGVTAKLRTLGIEVKPMGKPLSDRLKTGRAVLTF